MCRHSYYYEGCRTYGSNIPTFAQGAYFPGDEPGVRCKLYDYCEDPETCPDNTDIANADYELGGMYDLGIGR